MDVTDVLRDRRGEPDGLQKMLVASVAAHIAVASLVMIAPHWGATTTEPPRTIMTISIAGGGDGPVNGGLTTIGGRPIQEQTPAAEPPKREAVRPPAVKEPEMTIPLRAAKPAKPVAKTEVKQAPTEARGRTPTRGAQVTPGNSIAETGVRGQGFGLSTGGGPGTGSSLDIVGDFCCPGYIAIMVQRIRSTWQPNQGARGQTLVKFTIQRDGQLVDSIVEKPSGSTPLDLAALRAVLVTKSLPPLPNEYSNPTLTVHLNFEYKMKNSILAGAIAAAMLTTGWLRAQQPPPTPPQPPTTTQQPSEIGAAITVDGNGPPRLAVPDFVALSPDAETVAIAKILGQVLWDDLNFEHEFAFIPRDVYASIPKATSFNDVAFDRWRELNADGLVIGTVQKVDAGVKVEVRLFEVRTRRSVFGKEYTGAGSANPRRYAHMVSDDLHLTQRALHGVAQTRLTFASDRDGERMKNTVQKRDVKEIYIADYDGERQTRVTVNGTLNVFPRWSPDGRSIAYTSYGKGTPQILISNIFQATREEVTKGNDENWLAAWSPDGTKLCIASPREGHGYTNLYVINRDGSGLRKLTSHPSINTSPTWSPSGTQIAFSSDRTGNPQVYVIGADGVGQAQRITASESYADKPTWSPAPYNEIAYTARTGPGNDIKVIDMATREVRQLTFGEGSNESPAFAPNGRHIAFTSTRAGKKQIFTIARTGKDLKQLTRSGNNEHPDWSAK